MATLKRKPAQEDLAYDDVAAAEEAVPTSDVVDNSAIDVVGESDKKQESSNSSNSDSRTNQAIGRMIAGATPTLFGMLFGPQQAERGIAQTQKFFAGGKTTKLVPIVGPDGSPIYETPEGAIGEKVYQKPAAKTGMSKPEYKTYYDTQTKMPVYGAIDISGNVTKPGSNELLNEYIRSGRIIPAVETTEFDKIKEASGKEVSAPREKFGIPSQAGRVMTTTSASKYGLSEGDFSKGNDLVKTVSARKAKVDDQNTMIDKANSLLSAGTKESIVQAAGVFKTAKIITEEKISDTERMAVTQEAGLLSRLADKLQTNITGEQRQSIVNQMKTILKKIKDVNESSKESIANEAINTFASSAYDRNDKENKIKFMSSQLKPEPVLKSKNDWKLKYKK